jgi:hypothetical protein
MNVAVKNPPRGFVEALLPLPEGAALVESAKTGLDVTVLFADNKLALIEHLTRYVQLMSVTGVIWVVFPATESPHSPSEEYVRLGGLELGLEDTRRIALRQDWLALRLSRRRGGARIEKPHVQA